MAAGVAVLVEEIGPMGIIGRIGLRQNKKIPGFFEAWDFVLVE
jgi:hypothetical protein